MITPDLITILAIWTAVAIAYSAAMIMPDDRRAAIYLLWIAAGVAFVSMLLAASEEAPWLS